MWTYWTQDYAKRGYAAVNIDVRGFGKSGGCVEVWGANEQADQKLIVDWVADQAWSDDAVGFYGQSYVATTPVAAAVQNPDALKAIIAVAPVIDSYFDWHYGGVPNGESSLSPVAYQVLTDRAGTGWIQEDPTHATDIATLLQYSTQGICDPTLVPRANDPRAIHGEFFDVRDFGARAGDITAAVLYTQGYEDANVKSAMIGDWFDAIEAPKLGIFGHWLHQHPARMDAEALFLGWMDEHVKGLPLGIMDAYPNAVISVDKTRERDAATWDVETTFDLGLNNDDFTLGTASGSQQMLLQPAPEPVQGQVNEIVQTAQVSYTGTLTEDLLVHAPILDLQGTLVGGNGFVYAALYADGRLLTEGMRQLALDDTYETWTPIVSAFDVDLPFRPTELYLEAGTELRLDIRGVQAGVDGVIGGETLGTAAPIPAELTIENSALQFPTVGGARPISLTALP
jgi:putative CocE/NonD family hydrolase